MKEIDFATIEEKWQAEWDKKKAFVAKDGGKKPKYYVLEMFAYPSGTGLHMGHAWNFTLGDILARYKFMKGYNVLHPTGYDSLGLPAENAAIKAGTHPEDYTLQSMENFGKQQRALGITYDWDRLVATNEPEYYKWDQWIFLKMYEKGLAYQKESAVNWCPKCETVLANEQVQNGVCWRHEDTVVEVKHLRQWFFRTTKYSDELLDKIEELEDWPDRTKAMQKNWIGKSHGTEIDFEVNGKAWPVFTTRPDTIFGVTFMVIAAQHSRLNELVTIEQRHDVDKFLKKIKTVSQKSMKDVDELNKEGVFTGSYAINPANGEKLPIYVGNFVVADYGSGMVMADAHDQRDLEFAHRYGINLVETVLEEGKGPKNPNKAKRAFTGYGTLVNSGEFDGLTSKDAIRKITDWLIKKGKGKRTINYKLRDWGISRQRYWGTPIPIIYCESCGTVPVPERQLPVELPRNVKFGKGNPLETSEEWLNASCPKCGGPGRREADTMDTFVNSSWYFLRHCDPQNDLDIFDKRKANYWCPIDTYIGGAEHACMHLIYARFYTKFLRDIGLLKFDEPAKRLFHQGFIHGEDGHKMSKSRGNVIEPLEIIKKYGADSLRFFLVSVASPDKDFDWSEKGIVGSLRFIRKIFKYRDNWAAGKKDSAKLLDKLNQTIERVEEYYENIEYRKATIELRELFSLIEKEKVTKSTLEKFLKLLNPICPHITEEIWAKLKNKDLISISSWPRADKKKIVVKKNKKDVNENVVREIKTILDKTGATPDKIYIYVMPYEMKEINFVALSSSIDRPIEVFSVDDNKRYDPENRARKARPGKPAIFFE